MIVVIQSYIGHIESLLKRNVHGDRAAKALQLLNALAQEIDILENKS